MVSTRSDGSISTATKATARSASAMRFMPSLGALAAEGAEQDQDESSGREDDLWQQRTEGGNGRGRDSS